MNKKAYFVQIFSAADADAVIKTKVALNTGYNCLFVTITWHNEDLLVKTVAQEDVLINFWVSCIIVYWTLDKEDW